MSQQETSSSSSTAVATGENASQHGIVGETFTEKFKRKFKAQPLVPIGFVATAGILAAGLANFRKGGPPSVSHRMMKLRVAAQAFTVGAFILGGGSLLNKSIETPSSTGEEK
eukprot:g1978.t1